MVMNPSGLRTKSGCAGEDQKQFTCLSNILVLSDCQAKTTGDYNAIYVHRGFVAWQPYIRAMEEIPIGGYAPPPPHSPLE
jgi:hypothetical protein